MAIRSGPLQPDAIKVGFEVGLPALLERPDQSSFHAIGTAKCTVSSIEVADVHLLGLLQTKPRIYVNGRDDKHPEFQYIYQNSVFWF